MLWDLLKGISRLTFETKSDSDSETGWNGHGIGEVSVTMPHPDTIIFTESGRWRTETGISLAFSNVFRWTHISPEQVRLEHLRLGVDHPVLLFDLTPQTPTSPTQWTSRTGHQ